MARAPLPRLSPAGQTHPAIEAAARLLNNGQYGQAESRLAQLRRQFPEHARLLALHGDALRRLERFDEAIVAYQQAQAAGLHHPDLLLNLASCHLKEKQADEALALGEALLASKAHRVAALAIMGDAWLQRQQPLQARDCYRQALALAPHDPKLWRAMAHLDTFQPDSAVFGAMPQALQDHTLSPRERANLLAVLGKAYLDVGDDARAFEHFQQANHIMDEHLPPIQAELERLLTFTRQYFTPALFNALSPFGLQTRPQIIVAGMSRAGKSLVESLFRNVDGVTLAGEELVLNDYRQTLLEPYQKRLEAWLADQTPQTVAHDAAQYLERLRATHADDESIKITTVPGDLWHLGFIGLWAPKVPIIFCVRDVLDLGLTGFFQQYEHPKGYRYSYHLHHMGRQIACFEKVMEHWAQVLPNPVYLVDYEALVREPDVVMGNLLNDLGLKRQPGADDARAANAALSHAIGPIVSFDAPMPITDRFIGIGARFRDRLKPMIEGYRTIVDQFPRREPPSPFPCALPDTLHTGENDGVQASETVHFEWQLSNPITVIDNGGQLLRQGSLRDLLDLGSFGIVAFDPAGDATLEDDLRHHKHLQYVPGTLLGDGQTTNLYACLDPQYNSTLAPLATQLLPERIRQAAMALATIPVQTYALDTIEGLDALDWLILDQHHNSTTILEHGQTALAHTLLIQAAIDFTPIYERQPNMAELSHWAAHHGFRFYRLVGMEYGSAMDAPAGLTHQPEASELRCAAMLFVPDEARMAALSDDQRLKLAFLLDTVYQIHDLAYTLLEQVGAGLARNYITARGYFDQHTQGPSQHELTQVRQSLQGGELAAPGQILRRWAERYPKNAQVRCLHAELASASGRHSQALAHMAKAIEQAPDDLNIRLSAIEVLLHADIWWEAQQMAEALLQRLPEHPHAQATAWRVLARQPAIQPRVLRKALDALPLLLERFTIAAEPAMHAQLLSAHARLRAHAGQLDEALTLHDAALEVLDPRLPLWTPESPRLDPALGPLCTTLLIDKAQTQHQAGLVDASCATLWQACATYRYSPHTVTAYRKFKQRLPLSQHLEFAALAPIHQDVQTLWAGYSKETLKHSFGDFSLPYQGFEPLRLPGSRPTMYRLERYGLEKDLPPKARALDIGCNHGFLLLGLAPHLSYGLGFDISESCVAVGNAIAKHLDHRHIELSHQPFDQFVCKKPFDLVIACAVHHWIGLPLSEFGAKLYQYCKPGGVVLLESQGVRSAYRTEENFADKAHIVASAGFEVLRKGDLCDDGVNYREFWVMQRPS